MKHTIAEMSEGAQVWMCFPHLHATRPLLVTIGAPVKYCDTLMPEYFITVHERAGMTKAWQFFIANHCFACAECYDTETEAQEVLDCDRKRAEDKRAKLKDFYWKVAEEYYRENVECSTEELAFHFKAGFVEACMMLRDRDYLLKVNPPITGMETISRENDLWNRFMKKND